MDQKAVICFSVSEKSIEVGPTQNAGLLGGGKLMQRPT